MGLKPTSTQSNFTAGELSPLALGRFDISKYANAAKIILNFLINQVGGAMFRPGTYFVAATKTSSKKARVIAFQYSTTQAYILEIGDLYIRFYANEGQVLSAPSTPAEVTTTYTESEIFDLHVTQDADTMYITHPLHKPAKLQRTSATSFSLTDVSFVRGPFRDTNITATKITPSADAGNAITLTASGAGIFFASHTGSLWRVKSGVVKITGYTSSTVVTGDVQAEPDGSAGALATGPAATTDWAEGAWSDYRGWPGSGVFHEQRIVYAGSTSQPQTFWGSNVGAYDDFSTGTADTDAYTYTLAAQESNAIRWMVSGNKALFLGTSGGTFSAKGTAGIITASDIDVKLDTDYGVASLAPKLIGGYVYYVQRNLKRLRELGYSLEVDGSDSEDMNLLADHILRDGSGAKDVARQQAPNDRIWVVRNDGQIAVLTRNIKQEVMGWSRIQAGTDAKGVGVFESVAVIPQPDDEDQVWVVVKRNINGSYVRYIEYFTDENFTDSWDPVRLDSALTLDNPVTITSASAANPVVISKSSHGFSNGDQIRIDGVVGMTELNGKFFLVADKTTHTFELTDLAGSDIDGSTYSAYISGGEMRKMVTAISGLSHLEGETVSVQVDGGIPAAQQTYVVASGAIALINKAAVVHVGLPYTGDLQLLKLSDGSPTGTGQSKMRRVYLSHIRVYRSLGLKIGYDENHLDTVFFSIPNDPLGEPPDLVTGDVSKHFQSRWNDEEEILIRQDQPLPLCILCVILQSETEEL